MSYLYISGYKAGRQRRNDHVRQRFNAFFWKYRVCLKFVLVSPGRSVKELKQIQIIIQVKQITKLKKIEQKLYIIQHYSNLGRQICSLFLMSFYSFSVKAQAFGQGTCVDFSNLLCGFLRQFCLKFPPPPFLIYSAQQFKVSGSSSLDQFRTQAAVGLQFLLLLRQFCLI